AAALVDLAPAVAAADADDEDEAGQLRDGLAEGDVYGVDVDGAIETFAARTDRDLGEADEILLVGAGSQDEPMERLAYLLAAPWPAEELADGAASATGLSYERADGADELYEPADGDGDGDDAADGDDDGDGDDAADGDAAADVDPDADVGTDPDEAGPPTVAGLGEDRLVAGDDELVGEALSVADGEADPLDGALREAFDEAPTGLVTVAVATPDGVQPDLEDLTVPFALRPLETVGAVAGTVEPAGSAGDDVGSDDEIGSDDEDEGGSDDDGGSDDGGSDGDEVRAELLFRSPDEDDADDLETLLGGFLPILATDVGEGGTIDVDDDEAPAVREAMADATIERDGATVTVAATGEVTAAVALLEAF
ncbi:hypothetical protein, partial [Halovivax sp.]|uniref:hypothetical protein n=1 Tax=Halovivax sp. TaxID=1935978 RepID=UPI003744A7BE